MKKGKDNLPTTFDKQDAYYQQDWQDYYPTIIPLVPTDSSVLDVGCGRGGLLKYLRDKKDCFVMGLDISDDAITVCRKKDIEVIKGDVEEDRIPGTYDVIILSAVIEHLIDPLSVLNKVRDNLDKKGCLIVGVPNFSQLSARIQYLLGRNVKVFGDTEGDKKLGIQPYDHIQFFNKASLSYILEKTGYTPIEWSYHKSSFSRDPKAPLHKLLFRWIIYKLYTIDPELVSGFIAVKAVKV